MTEKRYYVRAGYYYEYTGICRNKEDNLTTNEVCNKLNSLIDENEQLKKDVEYWKQVASQYSNELNVFKHCKKHKTECKDIYWSGD